MANVGRDREISRLQGSQAQNWTNWVKAMVPPNTKGNNLEARGQGHLNNIWPVELEAIINFVRRLICSYSYDDNEIIENIPSDLYQFRLTESEKEEI